MASLFDGTQCLKYKIQPSPLWTKNIVRSRVSDVTYVYFHNVKVPYTPQAHDALLVTAWGVCTTSPRCTHWSHESGEPARYAMVPAHTASLPRPAL